MASSETSTDFAEFFAAREAAWAHATAHAAAHAASLAEYRPPGRSALNEGGGSLARLSADPRARAEWPVDEVLVAAGRGDVGLLEWLLRTGHRIHESAHFAAAEKGRLGVLQWLRTHPKASRGVWDARVYYWAIQGDRLDTIKWLRENVPECQWDSRACLMAAQKGRLHLLKWMRGQLPPCPWDPAKCQQIAETEGHSDVAMWIAGRAGQPPGVAQRLEAAENHVAQLVVVAEDLARQLTQIQSELSQVRATYEQ